MNTELENRTTGNQTTQRQYGVLNRRLWPLVVLLVAMPVSIGQAKDPCAGLQGKELKECSQSGGIGSAGGLSLGDAEVVMTNVEPIDDVFRPVQELMDALAGSTAKLKASNDDLGKAIGRENCETLPGAVARFAEEQAGGLVLESAPMEILLVNPDTIDGLRTKSKEMQDKILEKSGGSAAAKKKIKKIDQKMEERIATLEKLAPKISVPMPKLAVAGDASSSVQEVVSSVNSILETTMEIIQLCATMPVRVQSIMTKASVLPAKAPRAIRKAKIDKEQAGEIMGTIRGNVVSLASLPGMAVSLMGEVKSFFTLLGGLTGAGLTDAAKPRPIVLENGFTYYRYDTKHIGWQDGEKEGCVAPEHPQYEEIVQEIKDYKKAEKAAKKAAAEAAKLKAAEAAGSEESPTGEDGVQEAAPGSEASEVQEVESIEQ